MGLALLILFEELKKLLQVTIVDNLDVAGNVFEVSSIDHHFIFYWGVDPLGKLRDSILE